MKTINPDVVPLLPMKDVINGECVAIGIIESGVLVHYLEKDTAKIIEWSDIVDFGMKEMFRSITDAHQIDGPTKE